MINNNNDLEKELESKEILSDKNENINVPNKKLILKEDISYLKVIIIVVCINLFIINFLHLYLKTQIILDNKFTAEYEDDISFSEYYTTIKPITLYNPKYYIINNSSINNTYDIDLKKLKDQINLAKNHGIYGFGFYYYYPYDKNFSNNPLDIMVENKQLDINFLLIYEPDLIGKENNIDSHLNISEFFYDIKKYVIDERYIKFNNTRPIIGINNKNIEEKDINILRQKFRENNLGEIFILLNVNDAYIKDNNSLKKNIFDGLYYSTQIDSLDKVEFYNNNTYGYFYTDLLYHNTFLNIKNNNNYIFRTSKPLLNYPKYINESKTYIYGDYSQEKFYLLNRGIIKWTLENHNKDNQFIFIDNFYFLEQDNTLGYANINTFSKALYEIPFINISKFNLNNLQNNTLVLVQAHIYYIELLPDVINKSNNMPVPFDLYITTNTEEKKELIENYLKNNTKANKYEILITENKGRDVIPFLKQLKDIFKNYKYFCHIHTKKDSYNVRMGNKWQNYLYNNLLGDKYTISQILTYFENNDKLGIIFPEHFNEQIKYAFKLHPGNKKYLYYLFETLFPLLKLKIGNILDFPVGNMFWARTNAVYQIFDEKIINKCPEERRQFDGTLLHGIERIWLYLAKINGFYYKNILNYI